MKKLRFTLLLLLFQFALISLSAQDHGPYVIYNAQGKKVSYKKMMKALEKQDVVFFGELHNNPIAHWLQFEVTAELNQKRQLVLGAEMMEADNQDELNDYLTGKIDAKALDTLARLWPNFKTDYAPLIDFAKESDLPFVATNIPRRYANMVYQKGFEALDGLSSEEKSWMAPLPIAYDASLPRYQNILSMMGEHGTPNLVKSQATKDATMAYFISENMRENSLFLHYNGAYHSDFFEGILWYLKREKPNAKMLTISTISQDDISKLSKEYVGQADFIICVDSNMTNTY